MRHDRVVQDPGEKLLPYLMREADCSNRQAKRLLDARTVWVNGQMVWMAKHPLEPGDRIAWHDDAFHAPRGNAQLDVLHEDEQLLVIDKPAFLVSVAGKVSAETILRRERGRDAVFPVHRIDRDTTGCLIFARTREARDELLRQFAAREVDKEYEAVVQGRVPWNTRRFTSPIDGKSAVTEARALSRGRYRSHLGLRIETGRKHQIRRHLADAGHPVVGEKQHHASGAGAARQMLHAASVEITHPSRGKRLRIEAPRPRDFVDAIQAL